jgi:YegS/Rv2252/BmrU family lipid kinase
MLIIANPSSANGSTGLRWSGIEARLRSEGLKFDVRLTEAPGHASELAHDAAGHGYTTVVCAGGDGTLNEVVNGLMAAEAGRRPALGVIPSGTGTDFARGLGLPRDPDAIAAMLAGGRLRSLDIGLASFRRAGHALSRYFVNIAGLGFDGEVSDRVNRTGKRGGSLAYFVNVFKVLAGYENKWARITLVSPDGEARTLAGQFNLVAVCNGRYFGGGMLVGPNADPGDGLFSVVVIKAMNRLEFALNFPSVYRGTHLAHPKVNEYSANEVQVELTPNPGDQQPPQRMFLEAEGELFGEAPATLRIVPGALRLIA